MSFSWPKSILPKGLYGRAALILVLPVITIQLVVSIVFIQRHFDGVTDLMTTNVALELRYFLNRVNAAEGPQAVQTVIDEMTGPLGFKVENLVTPRRLDAGLRSIDDLTGTTVISNLRDKLPEITFVDLASDSKSVLIHLTADSGAYSVMFDRSRVSASNPHQLLVLMIGISVLMTFISFIFLRNQVRPIRRLARAAEAFGKGNTVNFHVSGATEVRAASNAFIAMRDRIERQIEQRTLMLSGVSHDLRTPLTRLKLGLSLVEQDDETHALIRDVDDMEQMLEEFLSFARGDSLEQTEQTDPIEMARKLVKDTKRSGGEIELVLPVPAAHLEIAIRPNAVRRALDNLVTNGLRYGSRCRMSVEIDRNEVLFVVEDDGPGIAADLRDEALRPFVRLDAARNQNRGTGVGLGLAIAMDIAGSHGGALELLDSEALGGLKAILRLPH